jgi:DNA-binding MarR family transcriptional regulator
MSTPNAVTPVAPDAFPTFGAMLRIVLQHVRGQMLRAIHEAGFTDFQEAYFGIFSYPLPDGSRPAELARQKRMSRQAINYLLAQLEKLGYVERRASEGSERRLVYLSLRGLKVAEVMFACLRQLHADWAGHVGVERFEAFVEVLRALSAKAQAEARDDPPGSPQDPPPEVVRRP